MEPELGLLVDIVYTKDLVGSEGRVAVVCARTERRWTT